MSALLEKVREYSPVALFLSVILVVSLWTIHDNQNQREVAARQALIIKTLAADNNEAIQANGDFQSCVWLSIIKHRNLGHQARSVRAIHRCEDKYLS